MIMHQKFRHSGESRNLENRLDPGFRRDDGSANFLECFLLVTLFLGLSSISLGATGKASQAKAAQEKESYLQKADQEVQDWSAKIKALEERSEKSGVQTRQELDRHMKEVDKNLAVARKKLEELRRASEKAWNNLQDGMDKALEDIKRHYQKAATTLEKDKKKEKS